MSVRGLIDLAGPVPDRKTSHRSSSSMLLSGLDKSRCVKRVLLSNSLLDFKQSSFIHIIQVLGLQLC